MAGLAVFSLTIASKGMVLLAFLATTLTIVGMMFLLILLIGTAQNNLLKKLRGSTRPIKRVSGVMLILVGTWLITIAIWADFFAQLFPV